MLYSALVFLPLAGAVLAGLVSIWGRHGLASSFSVGGVVLSFLLSAIAFWQVAIGGHPITIDLARWIVSGDFVASWALRFDTLTAVMLIVVTGVSSCVHIYSLGYMSHDPGRGRFMAYLSLFTFAMLMLVTADNLVQLFFGWEGVGVASYLLIGFWYHKPSAHEAAMKAFVVNRVGDFGFALGILAVFALFGTVSFEEIFAAARNSLISTLRFWACRFQLWSWFRCCCLSGRWANQLSWACILGCPMRWRADPGLSPYSRRDHGDSRGLYGLPPVASD